MAFEKLKATASVTIIDETDASTLFSNMMIVKGSKSQIYTDGNYSPDWTKNNLVIRPFLQATNVVSADGTNPDLFDPAVFGNNLTTYGYISNIHWFFRDSSGVETRWEDPSGDGSAMTYTYTVNGQAVTCSDARQFIIRDNILQKNSTMDIICRFTFHDPDANVSIAQQVEMTLINLASGRSDSKVITSCLNTNAISNHGDQYIDILAQFYDESGEQSITEMIHDGAYNVACQWYIRNADGWYWLNPNEDEQTIANSTAMCYEIMDVESYDSNTGSYEFTNTYNAKGGSAIRIYPALINGSEVIKCVVTDYGNSKYNSLQIVYDTTDETKVELHCSNGKRIKKGSIEETTIKAIITYHGELLADDDPRYANFDYYWYKYTIIDDVYVNVVNDPANPKILLENDDYIANPQAGDRTLFIDINAIDNTEREATFTLDLVEKEKVDAEIAQANFYATALTEEELATAMIANCSVGIDPNDFKAAACTAQELKILDK